jgi:hypothetical protein
MLSTYCELAKSEINGMLKKYITHNMMETIVSSYFDYSDILFFVGTMKNLNIKDILIIIDENTYSGNSKEDINNNFNKLITIMIGLALINQNEIIINMINIFNRIKTKYEILSKSTNWIQVMDKAIDNGNYDIIYNLSPYLLYTDIDCLLETKIKQIELSDNIISIIGLIHLLKYINDIKYIQIILNILLQKSYFSLIDEFITHLHINSNILIFIIEQFPPTESYKYFLNHIKINKNTLISIINKSPTVESYEYFLDHITQCKSTFFDNVYTETFYDVNIIQEKVKHIYAKKIISLLSNQMIINEYNRHDKKRKRPKNGIKHIFQYLKDEQIKRKNKKIDL